MRGLPLLGVATLITVMATASATAGPAQSSHVRGLSPESRELIERAAGQSAIVRTLFDAMEGTDVVVYVAIVPMADRQAAMGYLSFLTTAANVRYLVIKIDWLLIGPQRIVALAHELQHALEVAAAPNVRDTRTFGSLYSRIGWETSTGRYETNLARQTGRRVEQELAGFKPAM
jgi:hypothetical protein